MSLTKRNVVDAIGIEKGSGDAVLTIADELEWDDPVAHTTALQEKINAYLEFTESGQILSSYPAAKGKKLKIQIVFRYAPTELGLAFISRARAFLEKEKHIHLDYHLFEDRADPAGTDNSGAAPRRV